VTQLTLPPQKIGNSIPLDGIRAGTRRQPSGTAGYALVSALVGLGLFASVTPSPLYETYARLWHFSALTLTLVYATYAFGVLVTLLVAGGVSDEVGRRPVLLVSLVVLLVSTVVYTLADSVMWLFVARGLQGLATGAALSTASASMLDLHPRRDATRVGVMNGIVSAGGVALGTLVSSALVQAGTAPRVLPYLVLVVLFALAFAGTARLPEPVASRTRLRLRPQKPRVPPQIRTPFLLAALAVLSSWSIAGLSFSLGPQLSGVLFRSTNAVISGLGIVMLGGAAALVSPLTRRVQPWVGAAVGSVALAVGMVLIVLAAAWTSSSYFIAGSILAGVGFGLAFLGGLRGLITVTPSRNRGAVMAAFYIAAYTSLSVPAVLAGVVVPHLGLRTTFEVFGSIVAGIALVVTEEALRSGRGQAATPPLLAHPAGHPAQTALI
jgi:MFS family permease